MVTFSVHSVPLLIKYKTYVCSKATLVFIICTLTTIIAPLLIAYRSEGFWRKTDWYIEQPNVHFKHEVLVLLETLEENKFISWSTYQNFNDLMEGHILIPLITFREDDNNRDGINDVLHFNMSFYLDSESVHSVTLLLFFDYQLQKFCRLEMEAMAYMQEESALSGFEVGLIADLALNQRIPLPHAGKNTQYNVSIINSGSIYASDYDLQNILEAYTARNITTILKNVYSTWKTGRGTGQPFLIRVTIRYPEQLILILAVDEMGLDTICIHLGNISINFPVHQNFFVSESNNNHNDSPASKTSSVLTENNIYMNTTFNYLLASISLLRIFVLFIK